jgi:hypothetical protein
MRAGDDAFFVRRKLIGVEFNPALAVLALARDVTRLGWFNWQVHALDVFIKSETVPSSPILDNKNHAFR